MSTSTPPHDQRGAVARFFGSLANALIDLGLPTIRQWLRDRLGPLADVAQVTTEGSLLHLDGVRIPIGPRGLMQLSRATVAITAIGRAGLPEMRLHAFTGVLVFGDGNVSSFGADVSFTASPDPEDAAWIWGDLTIHRAAWTARAGSPPMNPMHGAAHLFVTSQAWRLDAGHLDGEIVRAHFAGSGVFEAELEDDDNNASIRKDSAPQPQPQPLVPRTLTTAALKLEHARVGPFVDAASSLVGKAIAIPSFVPLDAQLDGDLAWTVNEGGRADLRIESETLRAGIEAAIGPTGAKLAGRIDADVRIAKLLKSAGAPATAIPRDDDRVHVLLAVGGELTKPSVNGTITSRELGFRLGRPRFHPPVILRDLKSELFLKGDRAVLLAEVLARTAPVTINVDANVRDFASSVRGTLRADAIEAAFLRDVVATLGAKLTVPSYLVGAVDFALAPGPVLSGAITLSSAESKLTLVVSPSGAMQISGGVTATDLLATDVFASAGIFPSEGDLVVELDVVQHKPSGDYSLKGTAAAARIALSLRARPDVPPFIAEAASVKVVVDRNAFVYEDLHFKGYGARFVAHGTVPIDPKAATNAPFFALDLKEGGAQFAAALARLLVHEGHEATEMRAVIAPEDPTTAAARSKVEYWIPRDLGAKGELRVLPHGQPVVIDVKLTTNTGTSVDAALRIHGGFGGSTFAGTAAIADLIASGVLGSKENIPLESVGLIHFDVVLKTDGDARIALASLRTERLDLVPAPGTALVITNANAMVRVASDRVFWHRLEAAFYGGRILSSGMVSTAGAERIGQARISLAGALVHELPQIGDTTPSAFVHGSLSGSAVGTWNAVSGELHGSGNILLDAATFPVLNLARQTLDRYGLRPPNEDAARPVTATVVANDWGISLRDIKIDLHGASVRGEVGMNRAKVLDGHAEVTLEEEYLRTSKMLTLPRVLTERLVLPVTISGSIDKPHVHAELGDSLGRFLKDNRVRHFVESAVEEAQILLGRHPISDRKSVPPKAAPASELEISLQAAMDAHAADWDEIDERRRRSNA